MTTLFCDLVAFTAMSEAADPEDIDAVVGVYRVPAVHEDDLECTVRAAGLVRAFDGPRPDGPCTEPQKCAI